MEDTLRETCSNCGYKNQGLSLNPCFNGRYSQRSSFLNSLYHDCVLILVLMEDTLREDAFSNKAIRAEVLILVLMEDTLRARNYYKLQNKNMES